MTICAAKNSGFCKGVARAVDITLRAAKTKKLATYGPLIHNRTVTSRLKTAGVKTINDLSELNGETLVLRSHGVSKGFEDGLISKKIPYIDCTCPEVKKIHKITQKARAHSQVVIILGDASHPEVAAYSTDSDIISNDANDISSQIDPVKIYILVAQTTFNLQKFKYITETIKNKYLNVTIYETICDAVEKRQAEAYELAQRMDAMFVFGDTNSANTRELYDICASVCPRTFLFLSADEIVLRNFNQSDRIGVTAGTSTPPSITKEAIHFMNDLANNIGREESAVLSSEIDENILTESNASEELSTENAENVGKPVDENATLPVEPKTEETELTGTGPNLEAASEPEPEQSQKKSGDESFEDMLDGSIMTLRSGDVVSATVISVSPSEVTVNLGYKSDGLITRGEMTDDPSADITKLVAVGDVFDVWVIRVNDSDGNVLVSKKKLDNQVNLKLIEEAFTNKTPIMGKVSELVKGGLIAIINNNRVFVPSSQISNRYTEDLNQFKGKEFNFNILEYDRAKHRIVAGRKELAAIELKTRQDELFGTLEIGMRIEGTVSRIVEFGAFIDLGGVDGLVHISELAWKRVRKVTDVLQVGDIIMVTVIDINQEKNKISLTLKDEENNPWNKIHEKYPVGDIIDGTVARMTTFGAFITLEDGVDGLVHISQIADRHIAKPDEVLKIGQQIKIKVTDIDQVNHKISLSKREADLELGLTDDEYYDEPEVESTDAKEETKLVKAEAEEIIEVAEKEAAVEKLPGKEATKEEAAAPVAKETVEETETPEEDAVEEESEAPDEAEEAEAETEPVIEK